MAHEAVIRLPQGKDGNKFDLKLVEAASNNWEGFMKLLEHCDDSLAIVWLGQSQSTRGQGGLGSQENAGESTITRIIRKDALIAEVLRDQLIKSWAADNYGDAELAPHLHWQIDPPADEKKVADTDLGYGDALMTEEEHAAAKQQALEEAQAMMTATTPAESDDESEEEPEPEQQK
jgi:hypothetical protein